MLEQEFLESSAKLAGITNVKESKAESCPDSAAYNEIIEQLLKNIYEPGVIKESDTLKTKYNCLIKSDKDAVSYAKKAVAELNYPYTRILDQAEVSARSGDSQGKFYGVGLIAEESRDRQIGSTGIKAVTEGGAAAAAGIRAGDIFLEIDGLDVRGLNATEISALIRSSHEGEISFKLSRNGEELEFKNLKRRLIETLAVPKVVDHDGIVAIKLSTFDQEDSSEELKNAIEKHKDAKAFIIDLTDNGGGLIVESLKALSLFMSSGKLATERERISDVELEEEGPSFYKTDFHLKKEGIELNRYYEDMPGLQQFMPSIPRYQDLVDKPVVLLVNEQTASASEIFAVAMQEHKEATVIGSKTYGKGIGQTVYKQMPAGSWLSVTNMHLFSPSGKWLGDGQGKRIGITPDIEVKNGEDPLAVSLSYLRQVLKNR